MDRKPPIEGAESKQPDSKKARALERRGLVGATAGIRGPHNGHSSSSAAAATYRQSPANPHPPSRRHRCNFSSQRTAAAAALDDEHDPRELPRPPVPLPPYASGDDDVLTTATGFGSWSFRHPQSQGALVFPPSAVTAAAGDPYHRPPHLSRGVGDATMPHLLVRHDLQPPTNLRTRWTRPAIINNSPAAALPAGPFGVGALTGVAAATGPEYRAVIWPPPPAEAAWGADRYLFHPSPTDADLLLESLSHHRHRMSDAETLLLWYQQQLQQQQQQQGPWAAAVSAAAAAWAAATAQQLPPHPTVRVPVRELSHAFPAGTGGALTAILRAPVAAARATATTTAGTATTTATAPARTDPSSELEASERPHRSPPAPREGRKRAKQVEHASKNRRATAAEAEAAAPTASAASAWEVSGGRGVPMAQTSDATSASKYQCLLRVQIEFFVADPRALQAKAQGRNVPIQRGQVGIRCIHCFAGGASAATRSRDASNGDEDEDVPASGAMVRGAVYYPAKLSSLYQSVQNMANNHFASGACPKMPPSVMEAIVEARRTRPKRSCGKGKRYFSQSAEALGIINAPDGSSGMFVVRETQPQPQPQPDGRGVDARTPPPPAQSVQQPSETPVHHQHESHQ